MNDKIRLSLSEEDQNSTGGTSETPPPREGRRVRPTPVSGIMACGLGLLGIFGPAIFFTPLGFIFSIVALLRGHFTWAFAGFILAVGGFLSSPLLMGVAGLGAVYMTFDWQEILQPMYEFFGDGIDI